MPQEVQQKNYFIDTGLAQHFKYILPDQSTIKFTDKEGKRVSG